MVIRTGPERVSNDESPKLGGDLDLNGNDITVGVGGVALNQATITSSTTDDFNINLISTLNDAAAAGGSDSFSFIKGELTLTDSTGWDEVLLMNLQVDGKTFVRLDPINASLAFGDYGVGDFQISSADQNPATDNAGVSLTLHGGAAGSATTGAAGGDVKLKAGAAGGSGDNNGGVVSFVPGAGTGAGQEGHFQFWNSAETATMSVSHNGTNAVIQNSATNGGWSFLDDSFNQIVYINTSIKQLNLNSLAAPIFSIKGTNQGSGNNTAGRVLAVVAGDAGSQTTGAIGGNLSLKGGAAKGSGHNNGGNVIIEPGTKTAGGNRGSVIILRAGGAIGTDQTNITQTTAGDLKLVNQNDGGFIFEDTSGEIFSFDSSQVSYSGLLKKTVTTGITASITQTQGQQPLTAEFNQVTTVANANDVVTMPLVASGFTVLIVNSGANTLQIFPASGDDVGAGVNTSITLAASGQAKFIGIDGDKWFQWE